MNYAIIAAGEGSRLAAEGVDAPKPLVKIGGETLLERLVGIFLRCGAESIKHNSQRTQRGGYCSC